MNYSIMTSVFLCFNYIRISTVVKLRFKFYFVHILFYNAENRNMIESIC